jgi:enoyl-CoA hydratase/carnithine racemase
MNLETLSFKEEGEVAAITLLRPTINVRQIRELEKVCDQLEDVSKASVVVVQGHSLGIDFADFDPKEPMDIHGFNKWEKLIHRFEGLEKITVGLLDGPCLGGGFQLALAFDIRICTPTTVFALPEVKLGFLPGMSTWRLARYIGIGHARRLILTGEELNAQEALALGLVNEVNAELKEAEQCWLTRLSPVRPVAAMLARRLLLESAATPFEDAIGNFLAAQSRAISQSAFLETLKNRQKP